ncbi:hypothetical protein [Thiocapsa sp. N5-Cardenillas]|uniref:hypothetical protein n=1 Tax=Thiocapsa sp. N5-Cardenillas TaxID=3137397 RepID=UPI0035B264CD
MAVARGTNPIWFNVNLTADAFDDNYYLYVLDNDIPYQPSQNVFLDDTGTVNAPFPLQYLANGTLSVDVFFTTDMLYRLEFRKNDGLAPPSQSDALIYLVEDYSPGTGGGGNITSVSLNTDNQLTNPQFSLINFSSPLTLTGATNQTINVAPGWDLVLPGTGNATLTQVALNSATSIPTNAPYALQVNISGWNEGEVYLRQRFEQSGMLWANKYVSASVTAKWTSGNSRALTGKMYSSTSAELATVLQTQDASTNFIELFGNGLMPATTNTDFPPTAYVEYRLYLPSTVNIQLTSMQLVVGNQALTFGYEQDTIQRQVDHTFHVYRDSLLTQPKDSVLTGWDFSLNPWQFTTTASTNVATFGYTADQTIIVQQAYVASATGNNVAVGRGTAAQNYAFEVKAVTATNQFAMIQYIDPTTIRPYWDDVMSSLVKLVAQKQSASNLRVKMRLIYRSSVPPTLAQAEPIASWVAGAEPAFAAGWATIAPTNDPVYNLSNGAHTLKFEGMTLPASDNAAMTLGIVIYTLDSMVESGTADLIHFNSASLVPNDFAIESNVLTFDETLRRCEYYYEKSYNVGVLPTTASETSGMITKAQTIFNNTSVYPATFTLEFKSPKRSSSPSVNFYSFSGAINTVTAQLINNNSSVARVNTIAIAPGGGSNWTQPYLSSNSATYEPSNANTMNTVAAAQNVPSGWIEFQYTVNAQLGIVA